MPVEASSLAEPVATGSVQPASVKSEISDPDSAPPNTLGLVPLPGERGLVDVSSGAAGGVESCRCVEGPGGLLLRADGDCRAGKGLSAPCFRRHRFR